MDFRTKKKKKEELRRKISKTFFIGAMTLAAITNQTMPVSKRPNTMNVIYNSIVPKVKQLTKICWHLICSPSSPDFLGEVGLNRALSLVTSCCGRQNA